MLRKNNKEYDDSERSIVTARCKMCCKIKDIQRGVETSYETFRLASRKLGSKHIGTLLVHYQKKYIKAAHYKETKQ